MLRASPVSSSQFNRSVCVVFMSQPSSMLVDAASPRLVCAALLGPRKQTRTSFGLRHSYRLSAGKAQVRSSCQCHRCDHVVCVHKWRMFVKHISRGNTVLDEFVFIIWYMMHVADLCYDEKVVSMSWMYRSKKLTSFYVLVHDFAARKYFAMENMIELLANINGLWCSGVRTAWRNMAFCHRM